VTPLLVLATALAGGVGAVLRVVVDGAVGAVVARRAASRGRPSWPWGIAFVNVSGSFLLGVVTGLAGTSAVDAATALVLGTGLLGGYTTFSTASVDALRLLLAGRRGAALADALGVLAVALAAAAAGVALGAGVGAAV